MIPEFVKPFLWSYNISALNLQRDKKRIITNVLNLGTCEATSWLFSVYDKNDIVDALTHPLRGEWNKKSLAYWCLIYNAPVNPIAVKNMF
ncbi:MAG: hypothetical protein P4L74_07505 [Candidatus Doudnabacteria bacterium]|nr:hypothetical protein [Candidatus Doudnabacteria bacterium]